MDAPTIRTRMAWRPALVTAGLALAGAVLLLAAYHPVGGPVNTEVASMAILQARPSYAVRAPEFPEGLEWLNTDRPLTMRELRGRFVLLDFWTYCCINCMHILPDLAWLERKYADEPFVVIGVHSAKFRNEKEAANIREAILRYGIAHPVVNDASMAVWDSYAVRSWPTLMLIDPDGYIVWAASGEGHREELDECLTQGLAEWRRVGGLATEPLSLARETAPAGPLTFPGKLVADVASDRLFISDSNHNRIVVTDLEGVFQASIGSGEPGFADGTLGEARFLHPQGLALVGGELFVADTENHAIRRVDLRERRVTTVAGTGEQSHLYARGSGKGREVALSSPWDLCVVGGSLYIAMAGFHQIWRYDLAGDWVEPYAGTGREARIDGPRDRAAFAQPSGITTDGERLYIADSEVSSIRAIDLTTGAVTTLAGGDLFDFGDIDGTGARARLQHALGVLYTDGTLYIADTYNHKVKALDVEARSVRTLVGTGMPGSGDGAGGQLYEPSGFALAGGRLLIADTNNHAIRTLELPDGALGTLTLTDVPSAEAPRPAQHSETVTLPAITLAPGEGTITLALSLPPGEHLSPDAPSAWSATVRGTGLALGSTAGVPDADGARLDYHAVDGGEGSLAIEVTLYHCGDDGLCRVTRVEYEVEYGVEPGGATATRLSPAR